MKLSDFFNKNKNCREIFQLEQYTKKNENPPEINDKLKAEIERI